ncbi:hypothetical protein PQJ75_13560 [Rhodoplanes sp. TEM]|uniref:Uncharacterized protein n=1 Tax=Rhodoplanes tepidamans TaxID=200616 RepID=A0ABT5JCM3_RHOTP|nr:MULTISPECIES: hypothetical protein [Rhodoplanes]MDC7787361.1 hypothetical protein [Rhodoplanes tepidamans]MDC7984757.1 hypothetical protein [Rhodoplanes sp. TEM]MDQ0358272.1 hypothetical protein [Rhodoplanes tepidamans]
MIAPATIAERLAASRLVGFLPAVEAGLKPLFPGVTVRSHPGRIDVSDLIEKEVFLPPMIAVALTRWRGPIVVDGSWRLTVECAAYVVTEDMAVALAGPNGPARATPRQEVAFALSHGVLDVLADWETARWGLQSITSPDKAEARPLFTSETFGKGAAFYAVTWEQSLFGFGADPLVRVLVSGMEAVRDGTAEAIDDGGPA